MDALSGNSRAMTAAGRAPEVLVPLGIALLAVAMLAFGWVGYYGSDDQTYASGAFGWLEATVVIYLRELLYPQGFEFPLELMPTWLGAVEVLREASTLAMLTAVAMTAVGLVFAWQCESTGAFHSVMNLLLMPMWLLSGAFFPESGAVPWLQVIMRINPLTWCTTAMRDPLIGDSGAAVLLGPTVFALIALGAAIVSISAPSKRVASM